MIWELSILSHVLGLTDTSAGLAIVELAASASFNMALTFPWGMDYVPTSGWKDMAFTTRQADILAERPAAVKA